MRYLLLIYGDESAGANMSDADMNAMMNDYNAYTEAMQKSGAMQSGEAVQPTSTAMTVRVRGGKTATAQGPAAKTKEQLSGYYLIDCKDLNQAIDWAAQCPGARTGTIELRPIMEFDQPA